MPGEHVSLPSIDIEDALGHELLRERALVALNEWRGECIFFTVWSIKPEIVWKAHHDQPRGDKWLPEQTPHKQEFNLINRYSQTSMELYRQSRKCQDGQRIRGFALL